jgi:hypothetical protein
MPQPCSGASLNGRVDRNAINYFLQLGRNGHAFEHADVAAPGVSDRDDPNGRTQQSQHEACNLPENGRGPPSSKFNAQHQPVRHGMGHDEGLTNDVGALEVPKA